VKREEKGMEPVLLLGEEGGLLLHELGQFMVEGGVEHEVEHPGTSGHGLLFLNEQRKYQWRARVKNTRSAADPLNIPVKT